MEQLKSVLITVLVIACVVLWFKPAKYADPIFIDVPVELTDSAKQYIINEAIKGVANISLNLDIPISFGVITPDNLEQAIDRAGARKGNKGWEAALCAIEMANLFSEIKS